MKKNVDLVVKAIKDANVRHRLVHHPAHHRVHPHHVPRVVHPHHAVLHRVHRDVVGDGLEMVVVGTIMDGAVVTDAAVAGMIGAMVDHVPSLVGNY